MKNAQGSEMPSRRPKHHCNHNDNEEIAQPLSLDRELSIQRIVAKLKTELQQHLMGGEQANDYDHRLLPGLAGDQ